MESVERYEQKFLVSPRLAEQIERSIQPFMKRDHASTNGSYRVLSLYLDGVNRPLYEATRNGSSQRLKLRIRTYKGEFVFLEVKRKIRGMVWKSRVRLSREQYHRLMSRSVDTSERRAIASELQDSQRETLEEFLYWKDRYQATPSMWVGYERVGFESNDEHYARVTFDYRVKAQPCVDYELPDPLMEGYESKWKPVDFAAVLKSGQSDLILELKSERLVPPWMTHLCERYNLIACGVSKYCLSVERFDVASSHYRFGQQLGGVRRMF